MRVMVDPGHGGKDPGAVSHGVVEKDIAMRYADALYDELNARGILAALTRDGDEDLAPEESWPTPGKGIDLRRRCERANDFRANAFVSIHANAGRAAANGAWVLYCKGSHHGERLATDIFDHLAAIPGITDNDPEREVYSDASAATGYTSKAAALLRDCPPHMKETQWLYEKGLPAKDWYRTIYVLRETKMPAVLVELGFLTNIDDAKQLQLSATVSAVTRAIADGIEAWWSGD